MELDGAIPADNPTIDGVRSHIYAYGLRNPQGLSFGPTGLLYASEHGPSTDDEVDLIRAGKNYGWPHVAGYNDDRSYAYANWSASAPAPCASLKFDSLKLPPSVPAVKESDLAAPRLRRAAHDVVHRAGRLRPGRGGQHHDRPGQHRSLRVDGDSGLAHVAARDRHAHRRRLPCEAGRRRHVGGPGSRSNTSGGRIAIATPPSAPMAAASSSSPTATARPRTRRGSGPRRSSTPGRCWSSRYAPGGGKQ